MAPLMAYLDDGYPAQPVDIDNIVEGNPRAFGKDPESGCLRLYIRDPTGDGAVLADQNDSKWIDGLVKSASKAAPLNPARIQAGSNSLVFGSTAITMDTEHYNVDSNMNRQRVDSCVKGLAQGMSHDGLSVIVELQSDDGVE